MVPEMLPGLMVESSWILGFETEINRRVPSRVETLRLGRQWPLPQPGTRSSYPHDNVLAKLSHALTFLELYEKDPRSEVLLQDLSAEMRILFFQLSGLRYPSSRRLFLSSIGEENEYQQLWNGLLDEALTSVALLLGDVPSDFFLGQLPIKIRELKQAVSRIYIFAACCNLEASTFRDCLSSNSSKEPIESYLLKLLNTLKTHYSGAWSENELAISRQLNFMESVLINPHGCRILSRMSSDTEAPKDLLDDVEAAIFTALDSIIGLASSWSYPEEPVNTAIKFLSLAIYTHVRIMEEKEERCSKSKEMVLPFWQRILSCGIPLQKRKIGPRLSWIDEIGVAFWDCILDSMLNILQQTSSLLVQWKDQNEVLLKQLKFLKYFLTCPPEEFTSKDNWSDLQMTIKVMIGRQGTSLFRSCYYDHNYDKLIEDADNEMRKIISLMNSFEREAFNHRPRTNDEFGSLDYLLEKMEFLIHHSMINWFPVLGKQQFDKALEELTHLNASTSRISNWQTEYPKIKHICGQIEDVTCEMGYIVHSLLDGSYPVSHLTSWFSDLETQTMLIKEKVNAISKKSIPSIQDLNSARLSNTKSSHGNDLITDEEIVGFTNDEIKVLEYIVRGSEKMEIVLISGMPGIGKTTFANKMFNNQTVVDHFDVRSWCCVSQGYQIKDLLTQILKLIKPFEGAISNMDEYELAGVLFKELKQRRYLIVMDDIWDITAWDVLRRCFPNDRNGSRVLLTSRFNDLPFLSKPKVHFLSPLTDDESWELLQKKLCLTGKIPSELLEIGNRIAKGCKGIPLVVVLAAGLLADMNQDQWQIVACNVFSYVMNDSQRTCAELLELSYKNLPYYLKPCFLYLGCFPPDLEISCKKLIQLWIAEGFIKRTVRKGLECIADNYLMDLINKNLIHVSRRGSLGGLKTCRIHSLIHDFCISKGKEEKIVEQITDASGAGSTHSNRLIILYDWGHNVKDWSSHRDVHTLLVFSHIQTESARYIFHKFKLLRVLDLMSPLLMWDIIDLPDAIGLLVHLRFLAGTFSSVPSSIGNLSNLQTFCMVSLNTDRIKLPSGFYRLVKLRHLHISSATIFEETQHSDPVFSFCSLQTLSTILVPAFGSKILTRFPCLRKLKCLFANLQQRITHPEFDVLSKLESLEMTYLLGDWNESLPLCNANWEFKFPHNLKKLTLKMYCLPWSQMSVIQELPNLEVLRLDRSAFTGEEWYMGDGVFLKLKYLRLRGLNIRKWNATADHFPCLEKLVVQGCEHLEEIPPEFENILTLKMIEVSGCKLSVETSAREIYDEQVEYGNEELTILTRDNDPDKVLSEEGWKLTIELCKRAEEYSGDPLPVLVSLYQATVIHLMKIMYNLNVIIHDI